MLPSLSLFKKKHILLVCHSRADIDAMASSAALFFALKKNNSVSIGVPDHASISANALAKSLGLRYQINPDTKNFDILILLDFNSKEMLGPMAAQVEKFSGKIFLLDHHAKTGENLASKKNSFVDESYAAASEMVFEWLKKSRLEIGKKAAAALACGIIEDSAHFQTAGKKTFFIMAELLEKSGKNIHEIFLLYKNPLDTGKKIALLKAAQRVRIFEAGSFVLAASEVGAFEAESAMAIVRNGADIAFVGNSEKGILKISGRASHFALQTAKIDLAKDIFQKLGAFFNGNGGGHAGAAAFTGESETIEEPLQKCIDLAFEFLKTKNPDLQLKKF
ncbi:MAG: DHH family phosphoesterase [Candidatus ainarchaeum sp.]|nr:DHH family phosphoesterase [Candidatus ainarchaeum sp.]